MADKVVLWPLHMAVGFTVGATVGLAFTVTDTAAVVVQLLVLVTVTVYVALDEGETTPPEELLKPEFELQAYVLMVPLPAVAFAASVEL